MRVENSTDLLLTFWLVVSRQNPFPLLSKLGSNWLWIYITTSIENLFENHPHGALKNHLVTQTE